MKFRKWTLVAACIVGMAILFFGSCEKKSEDVLSGGPTSCDTVNVSYSGRIVPILREHCYGCHGNHNTGPSGGILLEGYQPLLGYIQNSDFTNALLQNGKVTPMPYGLPRLNDCELNVIFAWIGQGYQNN
jgi:hypothetical protein